MAREEQAGSVPGGLHLLLARADDRQPLLPSGLPEETAREAPKPEKLPVRAEVPSMEAPDANPNDLPAQRWGVVAPEGEEGEALLRALAPLMEHRERQQGAPVRVYRVPANMDAKQAVAWRREVYQHEAVPQEERPRYLLLLGDLHQVSMELQHVLAHGAFVGRLHVATPSGEPDLAGYRAYAEKVLASEGRTEPDEAAEVLLYCADDGTRATALGRWLLVEPCARQVEERWKRRHPALRLRVWREERVAREELLHGGGAARSGVMLTVSHGLGKPRQGWSSLEQQRAQQGALSLTSGEVLTAEELRDTPFLPDGMWFCLACFGAATPPRSAFHAWLTLLAREGGQKDRSREVLESLPREGERPFLAALPQAALANPRGPLAVIGHSDLAWAYSFTAAGASTRSRASRIAGALEVMVNGSRAGVALDALMRAYREVNDGLMAEYQERQDARLEGRPDPVDPVEHAARWMERNDLRGYVLLGDPAARLCLRSAGL
ncbi:hypothetical protein D187_004428 [Cystobacter fuscus DSM 2262]|uniref:Uncharacterized protein n=1 Tax=Cystobacter fuscus (strain ATCC 25194 / DSM 2262 / NBRC 100088 / M29) TaxID=1242864 RepID=S9Q961_CYSF2|nr:hypothetical protein [Cystobacter fuscus]EPX57894.1 hypothetical protein D187_004428 [Cystobacter fuscus DSM 2262]